MAERISINERLKSMQGKVVYESYDEIVKRQVAFVGNFAGSIAALDPEGILPFVQTQNQTRFAQINPASPQSLDDRIGHAYFVTQQLAQLLDNISKPPSDQQQRNQLQQSVNQSSGDFLHAWAALLPVLHTIRGDVNDSTAKVQAALHQMETLHKTASVLVADMQDASKKLGAGKHAQAFEALSNKYRAASKVWLGWTVAMVLIFLVAIVVSGIWTFSIPRDDWGRLTQVVVGKVVFLGVLYYLLVLFSRTYRANAHLAAVNQHRATALQVFSTFADGTGDEQTKNAILLETTRSIYSHTSTGFLVGEDPQSPVQVVEILKALGTTNGPK